MYAIYRHYRSGDWCPYQGVFHDQEDKPRTNGGQLFLERLAEEAGARDGDVVEISVRGGGTGAEGKGRVGTAGGAYGPTTTPQSAGCPRCREEGGT